VLEVLHRPLIVVVPADVEPVAVVCIRPHRLAGVDQLEDQVRHVQPLVLGDEAHRLGTEDVDPHADGVRDLRLLHVAVHVPRHGSLAIELQHPVVGLDDAAMGCDGEDVARLQMGVI
jgi:hypothetical protein